MLTDKTSAIIQWGDKLLIYAILMLNISFFG